ncbi:MAG: tRNA (guanosine(46)-N7)-methyltransferase TrmB [Elainellaceae cyanobacterium]
MPPVRVRQHVNPLSLKYQIPVPVPTWEAVFDDINRPLHLDIGSARGQFLFDIASQQPDWNFLGLEIRRSLVEQAIALRDEQALPNLHFLFCNANVSLMPVLKSLPQGILQRVSIQFPDPWFKKRHQKRRVVQPELVETLATCLVPGSMVFLQSDVESVEREMCDRFAEHPAFTRQHEQWLDENPLGVSTERENMTLEKEEPVYRAVFFKTEQ